MKVGILGGSFNPPHNGHLQIALELIKEKVVDKVIFIPNVNNPLHKKNLESIKNRYNMVKLLIKGHKNLEISDIEIFSGKQNYSYQTLDNLKTIYPNDDFFLIIGSDNLKELKFWKESKYLISTYKIIVIKRDDDKIENIIQGNQFLKKYKSNIIFNNMKVKPISSTLIRYKLGQKINVEDYISKEICEYIKINNLYKEN